ncbi:Queuine tRNA-ribosyltransferase [Candidatus Xenohaliotis californiensis]|uniref:Queuine tRNA-ribosyltransferase n=2 Tax=Candidatus Xenohaliotis californiensis TaxID=84677 RepID=A0ABP0ESZ4_9RICK|nr:Queuine tRNA-ribosyltransferase [Candidatus Xenohaliotis californiensis]
MFSFDVQHLSSFCYARVAKLNTPHGSLDTPAFIFCATKGAVKSLDAKQLNECNTQIILSNTYHLLLRPGIDLIYKMGGIHKFMGWSKPMLTDSGGFQIFSLGYGSVSSEIKGKKNMPKNKSLLHLNENGASFRSYIDGTLHSLTPEISIQAQYKIGADIILVLDECTPYNVDKCYTENSMHMSHRWALRSLNEFQQINNKQQVLYGIVQGGVYKDLREISCAFINDNDFFGCAIGGSLGSTKKQMYDIVCLTTKQICRDYPIHLLGIGGLSDVLFGVCCGVDTFDCVHPTRLARHGGALVKPIRNNGRENINLLNNEFKMDERPIESDCGCPTCLSVSRAYIHYLIKAKEFTVYSLLTQHNVYFMNKFMSLIRSAIKHDTLHNFAEEWGLHNELVDILK